MAFTAERVEDLSFKLQSNRHKEREAALKELKGYLDLKDFTSFLDRQTDNVQPRDHIPSSTWPGIVHALCECNNAYLSGAKKKVNADYAKLLRNVVKKASDHKGLVLLRKLKYLYQHLIDVIRNHPAFAPDYCAIVVDLANKPEFRICMSNKQLKELVEFLLSKTDDRSNNTLLCIVKQPLRGLPDCLISAIASRFSEIFSSSDNRIMQYNLESVTELLRHDGPNLGHHLLRIHEGARKCLGKKWAIMSDNNKELFILYLRMQLNLRCIILDNRHDYLAELLQFADKELDCGGIGDLKSLSGDRRQSSGFVLPLLRLTASILFETASKGRSHTVVNFKRSRKETISEFIKDRMINAQALWMAAVCLLIEHYGSKLSTDLLRDFFVVLVERLSAEGITSGLLWTIRCLNKFCDAVVPSLVESWHKPSQWQLIWDFLIRRMSVMDNFPGLVDAALKLLGCLVMKNMLHTYTIHNELWDVPVFKKLPSRSALFFVAGIFSTAALQNFELRRSLLKWSLMALESRIEDVSCRLLSGACLALAVGVRGLTVTDAALLEEWSKCDEHQESELTALDLSEEFVAACGVGEKSAVSIDCQHTSCVFVPHSDDLLVILGDTLLQYVERHISCDRLEILLPMCVFVAYCFMGVELSRRTRLSLWSRDGEIFKVPGMFIDRSISLLRGVDSSAKASKQLSMRVLGSFGELFLTPSFRTPTFNFPCALGTLLNVVVERLGITSSSENCSDCQSSSRIQDVDLDTPQCLESKFNDPGSWKNVCLQIISSMACVIAVPEAVSMTLKELLVIEKDFKVREELMLCMCKISRSPDCYSLLVGEMRNVFEKSQRCEISFLSILSPINLLLSKLNAEKNSDASEPQVLSELSKLIEAVSDVKARHWVTRCGLGDAISSFIKLAPGSAPDGLLTKLLSLLADPDFRVRVRHARRICVLFESWNGHHGLLRDVQSTLLPALSGTSGADTDDLCARTALITCGEVAFASDQVETEAVYMIISHAALHPSQRELVKAILNRLSRRLGYPDRWQLMKQLMRGIVRRCLEASLPLASLAQISDILLKESDASSFLQCCSSILLPYLLVHSRHAELQFLAQERCKSIKELVKEHFAAIFSCLVVYYCGGNEPDMCQATSVIQGPVLAASGLTEAELNKLLKENLVSITIHVFTIVDDNFSSRKATAEVVKMVVDGFIKQGDDSSPKAEVIDKLHIFRDDRVFLLLLRIHQETICCLHWRHRRHFLTKLDVLMDLLGSRTLVPSTFRYLMHMFIQCLEMVELQSQCCSSISRMIQSLDDRYMWILGEHLQTLVSKLLSCAIYSSGVVYSERRYKSDIMDLLHRVTTQAPASLHQYVKELDQFPDTPCFDSIRQFQASLCSSDTFDTDFVKFVQRAPFLPPEARLWSLQSFCNKLRERKAMLRRNEKISPQCLFCSDEVVVAVWELVLLCSEEGDHDIRNLTAEFLAAAGIRDPNAVVFHLPDGSKTPMSRFTSTLNSGSGVILEVVLSQLCCYLVDNDASVIELASLTVKGVLSTEDGFNALKRLNAHEKEFLKTHVTDANQQSVKLFVQYSKQKAEKNSLALTEDSLWSTSGKTYETWLTTLVHSLINYTENSLLALCQGLVLVKAALAELLLPYVFRFLAGKLAINSAHYLEIVSQVRRHIFSDSNNNTKSIQVFLEVFNSLRICYVKTAAGEWQSQMLQPSTWPKVYWLDVDYLLTAQIAQKCAAYFTSVLYVEHWCEETFGQLTLGESQLSDNDQLSDHLECLLSVFTKVNEPDSVYGILKATHGPATQARIYEHEGNWGKALETYDLMLRGKDSENIVYHKGVVRALQHLGCSRVNEIYSRGLRDIHADLMKDKEFKELEYESGWKLAKWDLTVDQGNDAGFHAKLLSSCQYLVQGHCDRFHSFVKEMKEDVVSHVAHHTSLESTQNVHPAILKLQIVDSLSFAWSLRWPSTKPFEAAIPSEDQIEKLFTNWKDVLKQTRGNFDLLEPYGSFLKILLRVLQRVDRLPCYLVQQATLARKAEKFNHAAATIQELKQLCLNKIDCTEILRIGQIEEAKVLWAKGEQEMALNLLKYLLSIMGDMTPHSARVYCLVGKWLAETKSGSSRAIMESYLEKSANLAETSSCQSNKHMKQKSRSYFHLAHLANALYQEIEERISSSDWKAALDLRNQKSTEFGQLCQLARKLTEDKKPDKDGYELKAREILRQVRIDDAERKRLNENKASFRLVCLRSYRRCLQTSDKYDIEVVFPLVSLWFKNFAERGVVEDMLETIRQVQSYKFLPLMYQIASRMGSAQADFQSAVFLLVKKLAMEHPYHSLYQILALANGDRIKLNQKRKSSFCGDLDKKRIAENLLNELSRTYRSEVVAQMKQMVEAYIALAELEGRQNEKPSLPRAARNAKRLHLVPVITAEIAIDRSCQYSEGSFPCFDGFLQDIRIMRGINAPKVVKCRGSDGRDYRQLAKSGDDDLRQDAVMEQLFGLVNSLLKRHPETRKRCLQIRTYKVIPFTPSAGVLEWVNGTVALGDYLLGGDLKDGGAHSRYGKGDWSSLKCREYLQTQEDKSAAFQTVCNNIRPVFRYFFLEKFLRPAEWFEKRLNYIRSVATSSMVGYIVGLGDRHAMNILIDQITAEVVHIDLGVAFEQGLELKTPETVPFRLTRDVVDGMGVSGVEGVFRRCCEATLSVLRANKEALLTIIEVFIHDPLYRWALSPLKMLKRQEMNINEGDEETEEGNRDAHRALLRVKQKLEGYEGGEMCTVHGQVQQLLHDAQDAERLCQLFPGWAPWL